MVCKLHASPAIAGIHATLQQDLAESRTCRRVRKAGAWTAGMKMHVLPLLPAMPGSCHSCHHCCCCCSNHSVLLKYVQLLLVHFSQCCATIDITLLAYDCTHYTSNACDLHSTTCLHRTSELRHVARFYAPRANNRPRMLAASRKAACPLPPTPPQGRPLLPGF